MFELLLAMRLQSKSQKKMETLIVKQNGNESIKADLKFRVIMGTYTKKRYDHFIHETYSKAKSRIETLKRIFKAYSYEIIIIEG